MTSWLRVRGEELRLTKARGTPDRLKFSYPGEYRMYSVDTSDEDLLAFWHYRFGLDAPDPMEIIEGRSFRMAGPIPNGRMI